MLMPAQGLPGVQGMMPGHMGIPGMGVPPGAVPGGMMNPQQFQQMNPQQLQQMQMMMQTQMQMMYQAMQMQQMGPQGFPGACSPGGDAGVEVAPAPAPAAEPPLFNDLVAFTPSPGNAPGPAPSANAPSSGNPFDMFG
jgi:hypothetical protein